MQADHLLGEGGKKKKKKRGLHKRGNTHLSWYSKLKFLETKKYLNTFTAPD